MNNHIKKLIKDDLKISLKLQAINDLKLNRRWESEYNRNCRNATRE